MTRNYEFHGGTGTKLHKAWKSMIARCCNQADSFYHRYGGRGIRVCDEWRKSFAAFRSWAISSGYVPGKKLEVDRVDNNGNYEPSNCRIVTKSQNNLNKPKGRGKSRFKGVCPLSNGRPGWRAIGHVKGKQFYLGTFASEEEAAIVFDKWASRALGGFASLNFPQAEAV